MRFEDKVKSIIDGKQQISRQQRRQMERSGKKYEGKVSFSRDEVERANSAAYEYGKQLALKAASAVIGLGPKRLERIEAVLARLEFDTFIKPFEPEKGASTDENK